MLHETYRLTKYPSNDQMDQLATTFNTSHKRVRVWFQNRRQREKTCDASLHGQGIEPAVVATTSSVAPASLHIHPYGNAVPLPYFEWDKVCCFLVFVARRMGPPDVALATSLFRLINFIMLPPSSVRSVDAPLHSLIWFGLMHPECVAASVPEWKALYEK